MKTKLYILITSLLMAACITSYGQEIISEFTIQEPDRNFTECDLFENEDGTLLFRTMMYNAITYGECEHLFFKITPEGDVLDSLKIVSSGRESILMRNPLISDSYILTEDTDVFDETDSLWVPGFRMVFIDANLNSNDEITVPLFIPDTTGAIYTWWNPWFIDSQNDFILSFWINDVLHLMRIGLDGTVKTARETSEVFAPNYNHQPPQPEMDTTLIYSEFGFGVFSKSPLTYYLLGGYYPSSGPWPIIGYFFNAEFNLIETRLFDQFVEGIAFDGGNTEHIFPFDENSYLTSTQITRLSTNTSGVGVAKFDNNHNPISASPLFGANYCFPLWTEITGDNTIYQLYEKENISKLALARLDGDLNLNWDITLPVKQMLYSTSTCLTILQNGDIIVGGITRKSMRYCANFVTLRDTYDYISETTNSTHLLTLYPNPVKDQLTLRFDDGSEPESVELYDLAGRLVGTKSNGLECIDMSAMPSGMYMLRVTMKDGARYHEKILKE